MKRAIVLCSALLIGSATAVHASPPDPTRSTYDRILVGNSSGSDMSNGFKVILRDVGNIPLPGHTVSILFAGSGAHPDVQQESGTTSNCTAASLSRISNGDGEVIFHAGIAGFDNGRVVQVRGQGVLLGTIQVRSTDLNADGATDLRDLNAFRERFVSDRGAPETDFNLDGVTNGYDLELLRAEFVRGVRNTVCP